MTENQIYKTRKFIAKILTELDEFLLDDSHQKHPNIYELWHCLDKLICAEKLKDTDILIELYEGFDLTTYNWKIFGDKNPTLLSNCKINIRKDNSMTIEYK